MSFLSAGVRSRVETDDDSDILVTFLFCFKVTSGVDVHLIKHTDSRE